MTIDPNLLARLVCPESHQPLEVAPAELVSKANAARQQGSLRNRGGQLVTSTLDGGLLRQDGTVLYGICDGIPIMLVDEGILVEQLES
jgi:uncharacterized protein YbaR (Trm112 family)